MNFTKLYYPTAEAAADDPEFLKKVLSDDTVSIELTIEPKDGPANIVITLLDQILFSGIINEEFSLAQEITPSDWLWSTGELLIQLIDGHSIQLTNCKLQQIDMLVYPISELIIVKQNDLQWIDTRVESFGSLSLTLSNPICMQVELQIPNTISIDPIRTYTSATEDNILIKKYLKKLRI